MKVSKDTPLAEITLRRYEKPYQLKGRELVKKLCLSIGLLQPGDSRDVVVDLFYVILREKKELSSADIEKLVKESRKQHNLPMLGIAGSNIRRQLKRLRDLFLIEKVQNNYRITENAPLSEIFEERIEKFYLKSILSRVKEYFDAVK
jgi:hypothetical protein